MPGFLADKLTDVAEDAIEGDASATMRDLDIYVTGSITRFFGLQGGYRWLSADYEIDNDLGDLKMKGLYSAPWSGSKRSVAAGLQPRPGLLATTSSELPIGISTRRASAASARNTPVSNAFTGAGGNRDVGVVAHPAITGA